MSGMEDLNSILKKSPEIVPGRTPDYVIDADGIEPASTTSGLPRLPRPKRPVRPLPPREKKQQERQRVPMKVDLGGAAAPPQEKICPFCGGAGWLRQQVAVGHPDFGKPKKCLCKLKKETNSLFGGAHIPDDFSGCSFETYQQLPITSEQQQVAMMVQAFVVPRIVPYEGRKRGLYLYGVGGLGKTGLAVSALRMALEAGHSGLYLPTYELFDMLYESIAASQRMARGYATEEDREEETAGAKLLRLMDEIEWLALDDLGVECSSSFVISRLYRLIEGRRSRRGLYTIFTSNKDARGLEKHWRPERSQTTFDDGERIIQRIGEYCISIHMSGRSLREKGGNRG